MKAMTKRMFEQNRWTTDEIYYKTGEKVKNAVICVGNIIGRRKIENLLLNDTPVVVYGEKFSGRFTSGVEIADKNDWMVMRSFDGSDFGDKPFYTNNILYIIRASTLNKKIKEYLKSRCKVMVIAEKRINLKCEKVSFNKPTKIDMERFKKVKGVSMPSVSQTETTTKQKMITDALRGKIPPEDFPEDMPQWLAFNFANSEKIVKVCSYVDLLSDKYFKAQILNKIRYKKPISLERWYKVKLNEKSKTD